MYKEDQISAHVHFNVTCNFIQTLVMSDETKQYLLILCAKNALLNFQ